VRRSRWRARRQPVRVATVKGGPGGGRISKARLAPSATAGCGVDLPDAGEGQCVRAVATPWRLQSWRRRCDRSGRRFVPPDKRPSTGVAARMGVSDPACRLHRRPWGGARRGRSRPTCRVRIVLGRVPKSCRFAHVSARIFPGGTVSPMTSCCRCIRPQSCRCRHFGSSGNPAARPVAARCGWDWQQTPA